MVPHTSEKTTGGIALARLNGSAAMHVAELVTSHCIRVPLEATEKRAAVYELVDLLAAENLITDAEAVKGAVWQREATRSTGIGHGLAIPHGKTTAATRLMLAIGKPAHPIEFNAVDGRPVRLIFLLISPPQDSGRHIQALAQVSRLMSNASVRQAAFEAPDAESLRAVLAHAEGAALG